MERERWLVLYSLATHLSRNWGYGSRYDTACIVGIFLWAVIHDRPLCWACDKRNWPSDLKIGRLPAQSTLSRRLRSSAVRRLLQEMQRALREITTIASEEGGTHIIDGKPLLVGGYSKDREARFGRAPGGLGRGYKLHAVWGAAAVPAAWELAPLNVNEKVMAERLIRRLMGSGLLLGDAQFDSNALYDLAFERGFRMVVPRRKRGGLGHRYQSPHRLLAIMMLEQAGCRREFHRLRTGIERRFGNLTSFAGGLSPLPGWVRRFHRVWLWVQAKLLINAVRILQREHAVA
jgi:hypothetical protein